MTSTEFRHLSSSIPHQPGIYKYYDADKELLYVGKAKDLRKRISSYFTKTLTSYKTHELVRRIVHIEFTIVNSEQDAFLLENTLIKQHLPRFNILLKDDKSYPYVVIKKENFPRVFLTRRKLNDKSEYIGPFTSSNTIRELLLFIKNYIPLRNCKLNLTEQNIRKKKFKVCLEYHLGNCKGPCEGHQSLGNYNESIAQFRDVLKGNLSNVIKHHKKEMMYYAEALDFENAELTKKKIEQLQQYQSRSIIVSGLLNDVDVFAITKEDDIAFVNYLQVTGGSIRQTHTVKLETRLEETESEILCFAIANIRQTFGSNANEIIVPFYIEYPEDNIIISVPKAGDKFKLLQLSQQNVTHFIQDHRRKKTLNIDAAVQNMNTVLLQLKEQLHLPEVPIHIECFDNSNFQGSFPVSAMVCFKNGLPSKNDYRKFTVKTVKGIDDFATMKEVVFRRYQRLLNENLPLPQLVIIDGGKGQLSSAMESISILNLQHKITVIGLAKNEEEIFFPNDRESFKLSWNSDGLLLIRRIRDEVHHFVISFHRQKRSTGTFKNKLEEINGIGANTAQFLLSEFKSVKKIQAVSVEQLAKIVGNAKAKIVWEYFNENQK